ncbi:MAG: glycerol-3-phosphate acyltransferase [Cyanobacteria bacterium P01_D01_bin.14]
MTQVYGAVCLLFLGPLLGGLPLTAWILQLFAGKRLQHVGTGNIGVSAAFYHGGTVVGVLSVLAEAAKGIGIVLLARQFFPTDPIWPIVGLMGIVIGRYWFGRGAGVTNVTWGFWVYSPVVAGLTVLLSFISFTVVRDRAHGRWLPLVLLPLLTAIIHNNGRQALAVATLTGLIAWIYEKLPDDLDLPVEGARVESQRSFQFFRGERALKSLDRVWSAEQVGNKAATLSQLKAAGYPVPPGYVLSAGDDPAALVSLTEPTPEQPVIVRSSAVGEDGLGASAAGQYVSVPGVTSQAALGGAIATCLDAYSRPTAVRYRQAQGLPEAEMHVLVQQQIRGVFSGVAFSRDPITRGGEAVVIEALAGGADQVVSGQRTPQRYQVWLTASDLQPGDPWRIPGALALTVEGGDAIPHRLIQQVAYLTRHLEQHFHGIPQDVEWSYDGEQLWVLQSRPVTTLLPIWTRKIAAEVIPGVIRPLTWSINRPLTCGVWGEIFSIVLGARAADLDFTETATLHHSHAYFNATLLGEIFTRMGLPPESLEFLTRGAKFQKPPLLATLRNVPGLLRLIQRERSLPAAFERDHGADFQPALAALRAVPAQNLTPPERLARIEQVLDLLKQVTYYNILGPLSFALRRALLKVDSQLLDNQTNPEIRAVEEIRGLAARFRPLIEQLDWPVDSPAALFSSLSATPEGAPILKAIDDFLDKYGYLSEVATDISVPTWKESPEVVKTLFVTSLQQAPPSEKSSSQPSSSVKRSWQVKQVQARLHLKGQIAEVYNQLLAYLRDCFVAQERDWLAQGNLQANGDIFFLTWDEVRFSLGKASPAYPRSWSDLSVRIAARQSQWQADSETRPPYLAYGNDPPEAALAPRPASQAQVLQGIGASPGQIEGEIRIVTSLEGTTGPDSTPLPTGTILVVPYTDAGWAPLFTHIGGLVAEVGGQLSHGAIVAREFGIPAVMDVTDATHRLVDGQRVRLDGQRGTIEIL